MKKEDNTTIIKTCPNPQGFIYQDPAGMPDGFMGYAGDGMIIGIKDGKWQTWVMDNGI